MAALLLGSVSIAFAVPHWVRFLPSGLYSADYIVFAEAAHRVELGQVPHVDFSSPIGPLIPWLQAFARTHPWVGPDFLALNALVWMFVTLPAAILCFTASSIWRAGLLLCVAAVVVIVPINVETVRDACEINYNGAYNRYGTALFLLTFGVVSDRARRDGPADVLLYASLLGFMAALKVTFAVAGFALLACAVVFDPARRLTFVLALLVLAVVGAFAHLWSGITGAYLRDIADTARANAEGLSGRLWVLIGLEPLAMLAAAAASVALVSEAVLGGTPCSATRSRWARAPRQARTPTLALTYIGLVVWTESQNTGSAGFVALTALALIPLEQSRFTAVKLVVLGTAALGSAPYLDQVLRRGRCAAASLGSYTRYEPLAALASELRALPRRWEAAIIVADLWTAHSSAVQAAYRLGYDFDLDSFGAPISFLSNAIVADRAAQVFRQLPLERPIRHVTTLGFVDEFTPLLGLEPARGLRIALDPDRTIGALTRAQAISYLAPVDGVFERTCAVQSWQADLAERFRPALAFSFQAVALTPCWTVHVRRGPTE